MATTRPQPRILSLIPATPGWVARYALDEAVTESAPLAAWALMEDAEGKTWVAGVEPAGDWHGRPCDEEAGNFLDYRYCPEQVTVPTS